MLAGTLSKQVLKTEMQHLNMLKIECHVSIMPDALDTSIKPCLHEQFLWVNFLCNNFFVTILDDENWPSFL